MTLSHVIDLRIEFHIDLLIYLINIFPQPLTMAQQYQNLYQSHYLYIKIQLFLQIQDMIRLK